MRDSAHDPGRAALTAAASPGWGGRRGGHAALLLVQLQFGLFPVFGARAFGSGGFEPLAVAAWRLLTGGLVLGGLALVLARGVVGARRLPARRDLPRIGLLGLLGIVLNQALYLTGLARSTPASAGLMICLVPVFTYLLAAAVGQERWSLARVAGIAIAIAGLVPLFLGRGAELFGEYALGNALMAGNSLCYAGYLVLSKPMMARYSPLSVLGWAYLVSLLGVPFFVSATHEVTGAATWWGGLLPADPGSAQAWSSLVFILAFPTVLAYLMNLWALVRVRASTTAFYIFLQPLIASGVSAVWLGEELTAGLGRAAALVFLGTFLVLRR